MNEVAITIFEKHQPIPLVLVRRSRELNAFAAEVIERRIEILDRNRDVPEARCSWGRFGSRPFGGNYLDEAAIFRADKIISLILVRVVKAQRCDVPLGKRFGIR